jgi:O-antigen/teichoic acid export membrane protein
LKKAFSFNNKNASGHRSFAANVIYSLAGKVINVISVPIFNIFSANYLGAALFGQFSIALVYLTFAQVLADFGLSMYITKETAKYPARCPSLFTTALIVNMIISFLYALVAFIFQNGASGADFVKPLAAGLFFLTLIKTVEAIAAGRQRFDIQIIPSALRNIMLLLVVVVSLLLAKSRPTLYPCFILTGWIISSLLAASIIFKSLIQKIELPTAFVFITTLKKSSPFLLIPVLSTIYYKNGVWLLSRLQGPHEAGIFQASYAVVEWILAVPAILAGILLPIASLTFFNDREEFQKKIHLYTNFIIKVSPLFCVLGFILCKIILTNYSAEYKASYSFGLIASLMIVPMSINYFLGVLLIASEQKSRAIAALACAGFISIISNYMLIPVYGIRAAMVSLVFCEWICLTIQYYGMRRIIPAAGFTELTRSIMLCNIIMPLSFLWVWSQIHWTLTLVLAIAYLLFNARAITSIFEHDANKPAAS